MRNRRDARELDGLLEQDGEPSEPHGWPRLVFEGFVLLLALVAIGFALLSSGCSSETHANAPPCAGVEVNGEQYWEAKEGEAQWCVDLAAAYTSQADVGRGAVEVDEDECTASFSFSNEDTSVSAHCDVDVAGGADCNVHVVANDLTCVMTLRVMP